ncbi:MAG: ribose 5-phosphate isomerase A [Gemmatimonadetes bacterium RBG_16_66_8]|nr:MAG: ribose 5-phosphate isomerase A [Gemmatimonadetes bacterium RBG_16_66_8]
MSNAQVAAKRAAALRAVQLVRSGMVVGLGTGSTARFAVEEIGRLLAAGQLRDIKGVPTSRATRDVAVAAGVPVTTLEQHPAVHLTIDGADEVDPAGNLIKGHGGALLWEKIVASASEQLVIVVDPSKMVQRLGSTRALPVEVVSFGWRVHEPAMRALGAEPRLRVDERGDAYRTDEGHYIIDCEFPGGIRNLKGVQRTLRARAGVIETGLFLGFTPEVIVGAD